MRQIVGEHTIDLDRLTGGYVLDAGCRNFTFAQGLAAVGCRVVALDADPTIVDPKIEGVDFHNLALAREPGTFKFRMTNDPQARHLSIFGHGGGDEVDVQAMTLAQISTQWEVDIWDCVKLDIEGAEYAILQAWPGPIARQISVEFHDHVSPRDPTLYDEILQHLARWYDLAQHTREARYGCPPNYWDSLFILKETH